MKEVVHLSSCSLYQAPAQSAAVRQGGWQAMTAGVAKATSRPERSQQRSMAVAGAAGRTTFMKCQG
mgnify:CR=1 FL=1